jgi:hypothetical protein
VEPVPDPERSQTAPSARGGNRRYDKPTHGLQKCSRGAIMKYAIILAGTLLMSVLICPGQDTKTTSEYAGLRDRVKGGDLSVDFARLRMSYIDSPEHQNAKDTDEQNKQMIQAINARDFKKAILNAEIVLENDYTDMDAHFAEFIAYREQGDTKQAEFHRAVFSGLIKSILDSGDGKSKETAYVVVSVHEEYVVLRVLKLQPGKQTLVKDKGHSYDMLDAKDPATGKAVTLFFNIDVSMNQLQKIFGDKK